MSEDFKLILIDPKTKTTREYIYDESLIRRVQAEERVKWGISDPPPEKLSA